MRKVYGTQRVLRRTPYALLVSILASAFALPLGETILAIDRAIFTRLERNFAFLFAFTAGRFVHFARPASKSTLLKPHVSSSCWRCCQRGCGKKFPKIVFVKS